MTTPISPTLAVELCQCLFSFYTDESGKRVMSPYLVDPHCAAHGQGRWRDTEAGAVDQEQTDAETH